MAEFPGLESWFLTVMVYGPTGTSIPLFGRYNVNRDRKLKLGILLLHVGDFAFELLMDVFQESVCWHLTEGKGNTHTHTHTHYILTFSQRQSCTQSFMRLKGAHTGSLASGMLNFFQQGPNQR